MSRIRSFLRYGQTVVELGDEPMVLGRSPSCHLVVDDELASREHCRVEIAGERVLLTDLASRNGVLVNGERVKGTQELHHGDSITIGTQLLVLWRQHRTPRLTQGIASNRPPVDDDEREATREGDIFQILHGAAQASLESDDVLGAETSARNFFVALRAAIGRGRAVPTRVLAEAIGLGLELADRSGEVRWLEQVLEVLIAARKTLAAEPASRFAELARRLGRPERVLDDYLRVAEDVGGATDGSVQILRLI